MRALRLLWSFSCGETFEAFFSSPYKAFERERERSESRNETNEKLTFPFSSRTPPQKKRFIHKSNHCPFVVLLKDALVALAREYTPKFVKIVGISSNSAETHPQDGPAAMRDDAEKLGYAAAGFRYLFDETQEIAKEFRAACTPEFYVFDSRGRLFYHGQFDDARPANGVAPSGADVRSALDDVLSGREEVSRKPVKRSLGCNIKWAPGNEPSYFHTVG